MSEGRRQITVMQGRVTGTQSGRIGGGVSLAPQGGRSAVVQLSMSAGEQEQRYDFHEARTQQVGDETWQVTEIHNRSKPVWQAILTKVG